MRLRALYIAAAFALALAPVANATIVGATYSMTTSVTGDTTITPPGTTGPYTDGPSPAVFCVGPNFDNCASSGMAGSVGFGQTSPGNDTITFSFSGGTLSTTGTFTIDLGNFKTVDGEVIKGVSYSSGNLAAGDFSQVSFNGTDALFTGTSNGVFIAIGGASVVFDVTTTPGAVPEPATLALLGLAGLGFAGRRKRKQ